MIPRFKIWDKDKSKMYTVKEVDEINFEIEQVGLFDLETKICRNIKFEDAEFLQSTGLTDKNGKEIFEGDIFEAPHDYGPGGFVKRRGTAGYHPERGWQWEYWLLSELEVIGNIYEHPDLLK